MDDAGSVNHRGSLCSVDKLLEGRSVPQIARRDLQLVREGRERRRIDAMGHEAANVLEGTGYTHFIFAVQQLHQAHPRGT